MPTSVVPSDSLAHDDGGAFRRLFAERFNAALDRHPSIPKKYGRVQAVATLFGISRSTATKWLDGDAVPELSRLPHLSRLLNADASELVGCISLPGTIDESYVSLDIHDQDTPNEVAAFYMHSNTLMWLGLPPGAKLMRVTSNDMTGYVDSGDAVVYSPGIKRISSGNDVYIFRIGESYVLRRARRTLRDEIYVTSEVQGVLPEIFKASNFTSESTDTEGIYVVGQVVARLLLSK